MPGYPCCCATEPPNGAEWVWHDTCQAYIPPYLLFDFGGGGWVNGLCDQCEAVAGVFVLDFVAAGACPWWRYKELNGCQQGGYSFYTNINSQYNNASCCTVIERFWVFVGAIASGYYSKAYYGGIVIPSTPQEATYTVTKMTSPSTYVESHTGGLCSGALPTSVTVTVPAPL